MKFQCKKCKRRITELNSNSDVAKQKLCASCLKGDKREDAAVHCGDLLNEWISADTSPDGSHTCLVLIGEKEDKPEMMSKMTGFYTHIGWYIYSYPLNFLTSEMIKWGLDMEVRYWKKSIDLPSV